MMTREATARVLPPWKKEMSTPAMKCGLVLSVSSVKIRRDLRASCSADHFLRIVRCSGVKGLDLE